MKFSARELAHRLSRHYFFWIVAALLLAAVSELYLLRTVEGLLYDYRVYITTSGDLDPGIVVAGIDEASMSGNPRFHVKGLGRWPWSREVWGRFMGEARKCGVRLVVFDVLFIDSLHGDRSVARELAKGPPVIFAQKIQAGAQAEQAQTLYNPVPAFKSIASGLGFINTDFSRTKTVEGVQLATRLYAAAPFIPSLDLAAVRYLLGNPPLRVRGHRIILGNREWPTIGSGHEFLLRWARSYTGSGSGVTNSAIGIGYHNYISVNDLFIDSGNPALKQRLNGKILIVGAADASLQDQVQTPVGVRYGVVLHANTINALLHDRYYRDAGFALNGLAFFIPATLLALLLKKSGARTGAAITVALIGAYAVGNVFAFLLGWWFHLAGPSLGMVLVYLGGTTHHRLDAERKKQEISRIYGRYLAPQVRKELLDGYEEQQAELRGALREVTVLESDIRGFTSLSENMQAGEVVRLLNTYFTAMIPILYKHGGTWDKFVGDALLAYFGAPGHQPDHAERAVACAVDMLREIAALRSRGEIPFQVGIGINTGEVKVGNIGADATRTSEEQKQFTIIGDTVNLAARLCGHAEGGSLIMSEATFKELGDGFRAEPLGPISVKGKAQEVNVYRIRPEVSDGSASR